jgi:aminoglycoside 3-N-acetyltransferase I
MPCSIRQLSSNDVAQMEAMLIVFGNAFNEVKIYTGKSPGSAYLQRLLDNEYFIALAALKNDLVVGGIAAYRGGRANSDSSISGKPA